MITNKKNSVLIINQRYLQPLNMFQEEKIREHESAGGTVIYRKNIRDTDAPFYETVKLQENLFGRAEQQEEISTGMRGYVPGFGFVSGTENG